MLFTAVAPLLALQINGWAAWEPRTRVLVCVIGGVLLLAASVAFIRKIGFIAIFVPLTVIGIIYAMNASSGCMESFSEVRSAPPKEPAKPAR